MQFCIWRTQDMGFELVLGGLVAVTLLVYLLAVLMRPERF
jgi:K+-transporting ATPase KdpF subunit